MRAASGERTERGHVYKVWGDLPVPASGSGVAERRAAAAHRLTLFWTNPALRAATAHTPHIARSFFHTAMNV